MSRMTSTSFDHRATSAIEHLDDVIQSMKPISSGTTSPLTIRTCLPAVRAPARPSSLPVASRSMSLVSRERFVLVYEFDEGRRSIGMRLRIRFRVPCQG